MYMVLLLMIYILYSHYIFFKVCVLYHNDLYKEKKSKHNETNHMLDSNIKILRYTIEERQKCEICRKDYCY